MLRIKQQLTLSDFYEMERLEKRYYPSDYITAAAMSYAWYTHWPDCIRAAAFRDSVIGLINLFPIRESLYQTIKSGGYNDKYLTSQDILIPTRGDKGLHLFLSCVVVDAQYRRFNPLSLLLESYISLYDSYIDAGLSIKSMITDNVTQEGVRFSESLGFIREAKSDHASIICTAEYSRFRDAVLERFNLR